MEPTLGYTFHARSEFPLRVRAAVVRKHGAPFSLETLELEAPHADEALVRVIATGLCHTDIKVLDGVRPAPLPIVLGHEGAGIVVEVGSEITKVSPGDPVVLTFDSCGQCPACLHNHPAYCDFVIPLSFGGTRSDGTTSLQRNGTPVYSHFFGQSSFATFALARERNIVKVSRDVPLDILGPLGCGFQTGAGAVLNSLGAEAGSSIAIFGSGSVGLSAIMAAVIAGCDPIIAIDINSYRLEMAEAVGATRMIHNDDPYKTQEQIRRSTQGGVNYSLDTTGNPAVTRQAVDSLQIRGASGLIGGSSPGDEVCLEMNHILLGRTLQGVVQGDSVPDIFIPQLIEYYRYGDFPMDQLIRFYSLDDINQARADMESGKVIKPVIQME
jgi:aryl-alcohol dehydrogenase